MGRIAICKKCGKVVDEEDAIKRQECWTCHTKGNPFEIINVTRESLEEKYEPQFDKICKERSLKEYGDDTYPLSWLVDMLNEQIRKDYFYGKLDQQADSVSTRLQVEEDYKSGKLSAECREIERKQAARKAQEGSLPKCPICGSTDLTKISAFSKVAGVKLFGLLGTGNLGKTYRCKSCGCKF